MQTLTRGALAGFAATIPMTGMVAAGRAAGSMATPPPVKITENIAEQAGEHPAPHSPVFQVGWLAAHAVFGTALAGMETRLRP